MAFTFSGGASSWIGSVITVLGTVFNAGAFLVLASLPFLPFSPLPFLDTPKEDLVVPPALAGDLDRSLVGDLVGESKAGVLLGEAGGEALVSSSGTAASSYTGSFSVVTLRGDSAYFLSGCGDYGST